MGTGQAVIEVQALGAIIVYSIALIDIGKTDFASNFIGVSAAQEALSVYEATVKFYWEGAKSILAHLVCTGDSIIGDKAGSVVVIKGGMGVPSGEAFGTAICVQQGTLFVAAATNIAGLLFECVGAATF